MREDLLWLTAYAGCATSIIIFLITGGVVPLSASLSWISREAQSAALFFVPSITTAQIRDTYHGLAEGTGAIGTPGAAAPKRVRVLIVPGHQPDRGGTEFGGVLERSIVVDIADALVALLDQNPRYDVTVARSKDSWNPIFQSYFDTHAFAIEAFADSQKAQMAEHLANGSFLPAEDQVYHNKTSFQGALQLYGINKWANENAYDITLHLHLNDDAERRARSPGKYSGFSVYVPDRQYSNAEASWAIGEAIARRLNAYHATSTLPKEDAGVVEDRELIAIGSNNSADGASLLIEYGYIYEPQFQNPSVVPAAASDYAYQTYLGLQDFFYDPVVQTTGSALVPYDWTLVTGKKNERGPGVYALQSALRYLGYYPPLGRSFSDCPISGVSGACTREAIKEYQEAQGLTTSGFLGPQTRASLSRDLAK